MVERESLGLVVKPTWLLTTICSDPPVRVAFELRQIEGLEHDALAGEGRVAMDQDRDHLLAACVAEVRLLGARYPFDHRVDELEMARVRAEREVHGLSAARGEIGGVAHMVFHVALAQAGIGLIGALELGEKIFGLLAEDIDQHVEPAPVRHPEHELARAHLRADLDHAVERRDHRLAAFDREALLGDVAGVKKALEGLAFGQPPEDEAAGLGAEQLVIARGLHPVLEPVALLGVLDMGVFDADASAVGFPEPRDDLRRARPWAHADELARGEAAGEIGIGQVEARELEQRMRRRGAGRAG